MSDLEPDYGVYPEAYAAYQDMQDRAGAETRWLSPGEAAAQYGISPQRLREAALEGKLLGASDPHGRFFLSATDLKANHMNLRKRRIT